MNATRRPYVKAPALYVPRPKLAHLPEKHTLEVKDPSALTPGAFGDLADKPYRFALTYEKVTKVGYPIPFCTTFQEELC